MKTNLEGDTRHENNVGGDTRHENKLVRRHAVKAKATHTTHFKIGPRSEQQTHSKARELRLQLRQPEGRPPKRL